MHLIHKKKVFNEQMSQLGSIMLIQKSFTLNSVNLYHVQYAMPTDVSKPKYLLLFQGIKISKCFYISSSFNQTHIQSKLIRYWIFSGNFQDLMHQESIVSYWKVWDCHVPKRSYSSKNEHVVNILKCRIRTYLVLFSLTWT